MIFRFLLIFLISLPVLGGDINPSGFKGVYIKENIILCHRGEIEKHHVEKVRKVVDTTEMVYNDFLERYGYSFSNTNDLLAIMILTREEINDHSNFPGYLLPDSPTLARYLPKERMIAISIDTIIYRPEILAHELAHFHNSYAGIHKKAEDEDLAYSYEEFFLKKNE